jgi:uncharacterized protein YgbK (DUF1537 family)
MEARMYVAHSAAATARDALTHVGSPGPIVGTGLVSEAELVADLPAERPVAVAALSGRVRSSHRKVVVLDDDPTGSQTVADVPVLTAWSIDDLRWALRQQAPTFYVLTNTRSLGPQQAADRNREIVTRLVEAARLEDRHFAIVSRGDSTLRGHYPLETDVVDDVLAQRTGGHVDGVLLCPAYIDAGRVTVGDVHWMRTADGMLPVSASEFARDATFGFRNSNLREFVEEQTAGRWRADEVMSIGLDDIRRGGARRVTELLTSLSDGRPAVVNATCDDDLRVVALAALAAEEQGLRFLYRTGPSFVRARAGLAARPPLSAADLYEASRRGRHGLVVIGSHVSLTTRQLASLRDRGGVREIELDVARLLEPALRDAHVTSVADRAVDTLETADTVVRTTRRVVTGTDPARSLAIARQVSAALVEVVRSVTAARAPRYVLAKGGITSSDVATHGLGIRRAWVRGTLLPGIVSVWSPVDGVVPGMPYVVFAGNVGDDRALADAVDVLRGEG